MERIVIHDLRRYKLVMAKEQSIEARSSNEGEELTTGMGMEMKLDSLFCQMPLEGWMAVRNPEVVFKVADENRVKVSNRLLKEMNPSHEFFERRKKAKGGEEKPDKKKRKRGKSRSTRKSSGRKDNG